MTRALGHPISSPTDSTSPTGAPEQGGPYNRSKARGLSDRQAVIAAMIASGVTCQDVAFELLLPLRTVQGHLRQTLQVLNLRHVEDLTYEVIAAHQEQHLAAATTRSDRPGTPKPTTGERPNALVALDAAEASHARGGNPAQVAALRLELETARTELADSRADVEQEREAARQLRQAVASRDIIGQAKGILMERHKISADAAFQMLQDDSNHSNRKLVVIAHDLIYSGEEPD